LRRAFLDRFAHLADPELVDVPIRGLLSKAYAGAVAETIDTERAHPAAAAGDPWRFQSAPVGTAIVSGVSVASGGGGCSTHLNVVEGDRAMVACTSTLGELFGSAVIPKGTGILLNNGMTWFDPEPGHVNSIAPRKRILWAPTPTLVLKDGKPLLAM